MATRGCGTNPSFGSATEAGSRLTAVASTVGTTVGTGSIGVLVSGESRVTFAQRVTATNLRVRLTLVTEAVASATHTSVLTGGTRPVSVLTTGLDVAATTVGITNLVPKLVIFAVVGVVLTVTVRPGRLDVTAVARGTRPLLGPHGVTVRANLTGLSFAVVTTVRAVGTSVTVTGADTTQGTGLDVIPVVAC